MSKPVIAGLMTARGGSKSVLNKNLLDVDGKPIYLRNIELAQKSKHLGKIYVSTDIPEILEGGETGNYVPLRRPDDLCGDEASHYDVFLQALQEIEKDGQVDYLVILLGNNLGAFGKDIDQGIQILLDDPGVDGVMSVTELNMFNPYRAFSQDEKGNMHTVVPQELIREARARKHLNDKNAFGDIYFFNGSFWICRRENLLSNDGQLPWSWLGKNIQSVIQKDILEIDAGWQVDVVRKLFRESSD